MAIIACLLILIYTGKGPTKRTYEMVCFYLQGWAELDELEDMSPASRPQILNKANAIPELVL